ncbi:MAG: hypothetical protein DRP22_00895 [Verrucomicrobia bacterium]|nr:MAG: hypothetical protein DRP22_00895 [Verrucomicrobiota bacterium]
MSLIQEALRRREEDGGRPPESPGDRIVSPSVPAPVSTDSSRKEWIALLSILILVLVVSASAVGLLVFIVRTLPHLGVGKTVVASKHIREEPVKSGSGPSAETGRPTKESSIAVPAESAPEEPVKHVAVVPPSGEQSAGEKDLTVAQTRAAPETHPVSGATAASARPPSPEAASPTAQVAVAPEEPTRASEQPPQAAPSERKAVWPPLQVSGIIRQAGGTSAAIVNGRIVGRGDTVEGVRIVSVAHGGVWLELGDERRFLRVGAATGEFR